MNSVVQENVSGARVVKAYTREDYENERFNKANDELVFTNLRVQKLMALLVPTLSILMNASVIMVIWIGGDSVRAAAGEAQVGSIMAAITYITQILMSMMMIGMMFQQVTRATASANRIREVLEADPVISDGTYPEGGETPENGTVEFRGVSSERKRPDRLEFQSEQGRDRSDTRRDRLRQDLPCKLDSAFL